MTEIKLCECGCGLPAPLASKTNIKRSAVKGQPLRFIRGHATGKHETDPAIQAAKDLACRRRYKKEQRERGNRYVLDYLSTHSCIDCGEADPIVLDFDHRNPNEKFRTVSQIKNFCLGMNRLIAEIEKCDVRCANCHRRKHYNQPFRKFLGNY